MRDATLRTESSAHLTPVKYHRQRGAMMLTAFRPPGARKMLDVILVALGLAFFAVSIAYPYACDRL